MRKLIKELLKLDETELLVDLLSEEIRKPLRPFYFDLFKKEASHPRNASKTHEDRF